METTPNLGYHLTEPPQPVKNYNRNTKRIDADIAARGVHPVQVESEGTTHRLQVEGDFDTVKFTATSDFALADTLSVNGEERELADSEGLPFTTTAWKTGDTVILGIRGDGVRVLMPQRGKATCTPPVSGEGAITLGANISSSVKCWKDQHGYVTLVGNLTKPGKYSVDDVLCTLPEGYRPGEQCTFAGVAWTSITPVMLRLTAKGQLILRSGTDGQNIHMHYTFLAAE